MDIYINTGTEMQVLTSEVSRLDLLAPTAAAVKEEGIKTQPGAAR